MDRITREIRFDIDLLGQRVVSVIDWLAQKEEIASLPIGCFGASTGSAAALIAAAERPHSVCAVVSRGGRPDLAMKALPNVRAPVLLIVGGRDTAVIELNRSAMKKLQSETELTIIPGATHLFEEKGALEQVAATAHEWLYSHLPTCTKEEGKQ